MLRFIIHTYDDLDSMMLIRHPPPHPRMYKLLKMYRFHPCSRHHSLGRYSVSLRPHPNFLMHQVVVVIVAIHPKEGRKPDLLRETMRKSATNDN